MLIILCYFVLANAIIVIQRLPVKSIGIFAICAGTIPPMP